MDVKRILDLRFVFLFKLGPLKGVHLGHKTSKTNADGARRVTDIGQTSVARNMSTCIGLLALFFMILLQILYPHPQKIIAALMLVAGYFVPVALYEIAVLQVHRRASTGLD